MREGWCIHFNGIQHDECDKKINYRKITGGVNFGFAKRMPCNKANNSEIKCEFFHEPTEQELKEYKERSDKRTKDTLIAIALIHKKHPNIKIEFEDVQITKETCRLGVIECPVCKGILHYSIASLNNHIWGQCETEGCLTWMM